MLFNKSGKGSEELNNLTGTFAANNKYVSISSEIAAATRELAHRIGSEVIQAAEQAYLEDSDPDFVDAVRLPVALLAVSRWSKLMDVSHEATGRKKKMDENEKMPFEWMLDRDDRAMTERYYRSLDALYEFLENNDVPVWSKSPVRRLQEESIVRDIEEFESVYPIEHSFYVFYLLQSLIVEYQRFKLGKIFGYEAWSKVVADVSDEKLRYLAVRLAVISSVITAVERWSVAVFPLEIARRFSPQYQGNRESRVAGTEEIDWYLNNLKAQRDEIIEEVKESVNGAPEGASLMPKNDPKNKYFTTL